MNRRNLIKSAAGLLVAAGAGELLLPERTVWALDRTMVTPWFDTLMVPFNRLWINDKVYYVTNVLTDETEIIRLRRHVNVARPYEFDEFAFISD